MDKLIIAIAMLLAVNLNAQYSTTQYITVDKGGSYRVALNGQSHGYIIGSNDLSQDKFLIHSNGDSYFNGGNVGIGTLNPKTKLQIEGGAGIQSRLRIASPSVGASASFDITMGTADDDLAAGLKAYVPIGQPGVDRVFLGLYTTTYNNGLQSRAERLTIADNGYVGIGTLNPKVKFQVEGSSGVQNRLRIASPGVGASASFDITMGTTDDNLGAGLKAYVPSDQPGVDRIFLGLYTTTYNSGLQSRVERMTITDTGNVGIGTTTPGSFKLAVNGKIWSQEVNVAMTNPGPDYVFEKNYNLLPLSQLESYINQNKHLPEVPSAKQMEENGLNLKEMNLILLRKIEELTLHVIDQNKLINELQKERKPSPDSSMKRLEELTLHLIEQNRINADQQRVNEQLLIEIANLKKN
jgi:hypothetical protein